MREHLVVWWTRHRGGRLWWVSVLPYISPISAVSRETAKAMAAAQQPFPSTWSHTPKPSDSSHLKLTVYNSHVEDRSINLPWDVNLAAEGHRRCQACLQVLCLPLAFLLKKSGRWCVHNSPLVADEYPLVILHWNEGEPVEPTALFMVVGCDWNVFTCLFASMLCNDWCWGFNFYMFTYQFWGLRCPNWNSYEVLPSPKHNNGEKIKKVFCLQNPPSNMPILLLHPWFLTPWAWAEATVRRPAVVI